MASEKVALPARTRVKVGKNEKLAPENERYMRACADIANALIQEYEAQKDDSKPKKDVNLNSLRGQMAKKHRLSNSRLSRQLLPQCRRTIRNTSCQSLLRNLFEHPPASQS